MGSGIEYNDPTKEGILPRAIMHIFQRCASYEREAELKGIDLPKCVVSCQFIEVKIIEKKNFYLIYFFHRFIMKTFMIYSIKKISIFVHKKIPINMWYLKIVMAK
jgi:hypothetical protein